MIKRNERKRLITCLKHRNLYIICKDCNQLVMLTVYSFTNYIIGKLGEKKEKEKEEDVMNVLDLILRTNCLLQVV